MLRCDWLVFNSYDDIVRQTVILYYYCSSLFLVLPLFTVNQFSFLLFSYWKGQVLTYDNIRDVIKFCAREKLVLFADEVYQETVFTKEAKFHSCKKVLKDLGAEYDKFQLMSIQSVSKGFYGE